MQIKNTKEIRRLSSILLLLFFIFIPIFGYSVETVVPPGAPGTGITYSCGEGLTFGNCTFDDLIRAVTRLVNFGVTITLSFSVVVIAYAGYLYMISGDKPAERTKANTTLLKVVKGIVFILAAWLIVTLITSTLLRLEVQGLVPLR